MPETCATRPRLRIVQLNCGRAYSMMDNIRHMINCGYDFACISEPYVANLDKIHISGANAYYDFNSSEPKTIIYALNKSIRCTVIKSTQFHVSIHLIDIGITLNSHYISPLRNEINDLTFNSFISQLNNNARLTLHLGDFNGRSKYLLNDKATNYRGTRIVNRCEQNGWRILNTPGVFTFTGQSGQSVVKSSIVDLSICSPDIESKIDWSILDDNEIILADHKPILTSIEVEHLTSASNKTKYKSRKFLQLIKLYMKTNPANWYDNLTDALQNSKDDSPQLKERWKLPLELQIERTKIDKLARRCRRRRLSADSIEVQSLKAMKKNYRYSIKKARLEAFDKFISELTEHEAFRSCWKWIRRGSNNGIYRMNINDSITYDMKLIFESALASYYPITSDESGEFINMTSNIADDPPFTMDEIEYTIKSLSNNKAPGSDMMPTKLLKSWFAADPKSIKSIVDDMFKNNQFPMPYKDCKIILLKKKPVNVPRLNECRPIGLGSVLGKLLEKLIISRINYHCMKNGFITEAQHGFMEGKSCATALYELDRALVREPNKYKLCFSIDIKGAFNNIKHASIIKALVDCGCPRNIVELWKSYLTNRTVTMEENGISVTRNMYRGCVQGSPGGPLNYILATSNIIKEIQGEINNEQNNCTLIVFADDCSGVISIDANDEVTAKNKLLNIAVKIIDKFSEKFNRIGLQVAPEKTQLLFISDEFTATYMYHNGVLFSLSKYCKILGLTIKHDHTYDEHVMIRLGKAKAAMGAMTKYCRLKFGLNNDIRAAIVNKAITPMISYAAGIWYPKIKQATKNEIKKFNRWATIVTTGCYKSVSYASSLIIGKFSPVHHEVMKRSAIELQKIKKWSDKYNAIIQTKATIASCSHPAYPLNWQLYDQIKSPSEVSRIDGFDAYIYTDGSRPGDPDMNAGAAIVMMKNNYSKSGSVRRLKLSSHVTSFQAELIALELALKMATEHNNKFTTLCICSDSLSSLMAIMNPRTRNKIVLGIQLRLVLLSAVQKEVKLVHVSSHVDIHGNELADKFANEACEIGEYYPTAVEARVINREENEAMTRRIEHEYLTTKWGRTIKKFCPSIYSGARDLISINRHTVKIYTGHGTFRNYLHERKKASNNLCLCDQKTVQDVEHVLINCPLFSDIKQAHRKEVKINLPIRSEYWDELCITPEWHRFIFIIAPEINSRLVIVHNEYEVSLDKLEFVI